MEFIPAVVNRHLDSLHFTEDGALLLAASSLTNRYWTGSLWHFDCPDSAPDTERCAAGVELNCGISDAKWINGSSNIIAACDSGNLALYELCDKGHTFKHLSQAMAHDDIVTSISVNTDQKKATSSSQDTRIKLWDMEEFTCTATYQAHWDTVWSTAWHPSEASVFLSSSQDGRLILWDIRKSKPAVVLRNTSLPALPTCVAWQPSSKLSVAVGTEAGHLLLLDLRNVAAPSSTSIKCHDRGVHRIVFAPASSNLLASVSDDCTTAVTNFSGSAPQLIYKDETSHSDFVHGVDWNPVDGRLFSCGWDYNVVGRTVPLLGSAVLKTNGLAPETMDTSLQNHNLDGGEITDKTRVETSDQQLDVISMSGEK